ncbi:hypothetical protein LTR66_000907 [Elasticomyces elasticus]|nr:hypothetical protein LTR66_000907 [Elasticomyces elasticus]
MVLPDCPPPSRDGDNSRSSSLYKSRHISLQSRIDSLAAESMWDESRESVPEIPAIYGQWGRSTSLLVDSNMGKSTIDLHRGPESMADSEALPSKDPLPPQQIRLGTLPEVMFIGVVVISNFMALAALGQAISPVHIIAGSFGVNNPGEEAWFSAAYSLTLGTFILISGRLGDILGHKRMFVFGYAFLGVWSCFAGFAVYPGRQVFFDVCRAMQGMGSALLAPNALALLARAYPPGIKKNIVFSLFGAMAPWGFVVGALFGAVYSELAWWPWTFWSYGIAAFCLSTFALLVIPKALAKEAQFAGMSQPPGFDATGSVLGVAGLVLVNVAWNNGPLYGWHTPHVYFVLIIGLLCMVGFVWVEGRAVSPILPIHALNSSAVYTLSLVGIGWGSFGIWIYYTWRFCEELRLQTPLTVSAEYIPALICGLLAAAMLAFFIGHVIAGTMPVKQTYWAQLFISILIMPFGMDMSFPAATVILSNNMPREHQGLAASLVNTMVNYSISIALGIAGTVETSANGRGTTAADNERGIRFAYYTGIALSFFGVILGALFFVRTMLKEGWKIMEH